VTLDVITSIVLDHLSWVDFQVHPACLWRIIDGALMLIGVLLVVSF
jgi:transporter family-2 protein